MSLRSLRSLKPFLESKSKSKSTSLSLSIEPIKTKELKEFENKEGKKHPLGELEVLGVLEALHGVEAAVGDPPFEPEQKS